ncbi:MAG: glycosyltransferase family 4 protein [Candidatus Enteromonas sp.]
MIPFCSVYNEAVKILVVCQHYYPENFSISSLCETFVEDGHEVLVVTGKPNYGYGRILEGYENVTDEVIRGVRVHRVNLIARSEGRMSIVKNYLSFWKNSKKYLSHLKEEFDVVYSMSLSPVISIAGANIYARKHKVRHVLHCLDLWPESVAITHAISKGNPLYWALYFWSRSLYSKTSKVLVSSPSFIDYFRHVLHLKKLPIEYVPQPPFLAEKAGADVQYPHRYNLVYAGNVGTLQLVENLAKATEKAAKSVDVCLHIIGMGARSKALKEWIEEANAQDHVVLYGTRPRGVTATFFPNATGIVVTLTSGGTVGKTIPSKLNASLCFARPVLACIEGDGKEVLKEAKGSVFSAGESVDELANAILALCSLSDEERENLGKNNLAYFNDHFCMSRIAKTIEEELKTK